MVSTKDFSKFRCLLEESQSIKDFLDRYLLTVSKPGRYVGGEFNQIVKNWEQIPLRIALAFPDVYEIGLPNLGLAILYDQVNRRKDALAERVYCPWMDMEELMRAREIPLFSLENKVPLRNFDIIGFTLPYETLYTNLLNMLDLSRIPLRASERSEADPLIIAGGHACFNPEPVYAFVDAFVIGEGEEIIHEILDSVKLFKENGSSRKDLLRKLDEIPGIYVPAFFEVRVQKSGAIDGIRHTSDGNKPRVLKRIVKKLPEPVTRFLVPNIKTVNERVSVEIMRGCSRGCRFCQAGMITRPIRERSSDEVLNAIRTSVEATGFEEISLLSLSTSDHSQITDIIQGIMEMNESMNLAFSLPSLRVESFTPELISTMQAKRKGNFTIAPEAGSEAMRRRVNKAISEEEILGTATQIFRMGWTNLKLYFMIGFPEETLEDVQGIVNLCRQITGIGKRLVGGRLKLHVSVNTLIPKSHTPFQWLPFSNQDEISEKYRLIVEGLKKTGIQVDWPNYRHSLLEVWLSRGDRRLADVVEAAWRSGARFDAWHENFDYQKWMDAFESCDINPDDYALRPRSTEEILPWDHIDSGITKKFLLRELEKSQKGEISADCRRMCHACGIQNNYTISCDEIRMGA